MSSPPWFTPPASYATGYLEDYDSYHLRYIALKCYEKHNTTFFDDCCRPMLATENLMDNRKAFCNPWPTTMTSSPSPVPSSIFQSSSISPSSTSLSPLTTSIPSRPVNHRLLTILLPALLGSLLLLALLLCVLHRRRRARAEARRSGPISNQSTRSTGYLGRLWGDPPSPPRPHYQTYHSNVLAYHDARSPPSTILPDPPAYKRLQAGRYAPFSQQLVALGEGIPSRDSLSSSDSDQEEGEFVVINRLGREARPLLDRPRSRESSTGTYSTILRRDSRLASGLFYTLEDAQRDQRVVAEAKRQEEAGPSRLRDANEEPLFAIGSDGEGDISDAEALVEGRAELREARLSQRGAAFTIPLLVRSLDFGSPLGTTPLTSPSVAPPFFLTPSPSSPTRRRLPPTPLAFDFPSPSHLRPSSFQSGPLQRPSSVQLSSSADDSFVEAQMAQRPSSMVTTGSFAARPRGVEVLARSSRPSSGLRRESYTSSHTSIYHSAPTTPLPTDEPQWSTSPQSPGLSTSAHPVLLPFETFNRPFLDSSLPSMTRSSLNDRPFVLHLPKPSYSSTSSCQHQPNLSYSSSPTDSTFSYARTDSQPAPSVRLIPRKPVMLTSAFGSTSCEGREADPSSSSSSRLNRLGGLEDWVRGRAGMGLRGSRSGGAEGLVGFTGDDQSVLDRRLGRHARLVNPDSRPLSARVSVHEDVSSSASSPTPSPPADGTWGRHSLGMRPLPPTPPAYTAMPRRRPNDEEEEDESDALLDLAGRRGL